MAKAMVILFAIFAAHSFGAEPAWGLAVHGLRIGLSVAPVSAEPALLVVFQNTGPDSLDALWGARTGKGEMYNLRFSAVNREGKRCEVLNLAGAGGVAGLLLPITLHLAPGETRDVSLPMNRLICVENRVDIPLDRLLARDYTVHALFTADAKGAAWANIRAPWIGEVNSAEFPVIRGQAVARQKWHNELQWNFLSAPFQPW